jgi:hypothetical protein
MADKTLIDLWNDSEDYVTQSSDDMAKDLRSKFKKNPTSLYIESKDLDNILGPQKQTMKEYIKNEIGNKFDKFYTKTVAGDFLIFKRFKEYRGVKVYELNDDSGYYIIETKKYKYFFNVYMTNSIKGVENTLVFVDYHGYMTIYDIKNDEFNEGA